MRLCGSGEIKNETIMCVRKGKDVVTINDIAKMAGVAKSTVSRYLNGGSVSEKTRQKLMAIIQETGYRPNVFAQSLKAKKTGIIGVVIPRLGSAATDAILKGIDRVARENNQRIFIVNTEQDSQREIEAIEVLAKQKVDYIILIATLLNDTHLQIIEQVDTPVIILGQASDSIPSVRYDDYGAGRLIGEHIKQLGHKHVLYIGVSETDKAVGVDRKKGVLDTFENTDVTVEVIETTFHLQDAYRLGLSVLPFTKATYIVAATDNIALGFLKAAYECGKKVPDDVSLSGFGGYENTSAVHPALTTVVFPYQETGEYVMTQLNENGVFEEQKILPVTLLNRASTDFFRK